MVQRRLRSSTEASVLPAPNLVRADASDFTRWVTSRRVGHGWRRGAMWVAKEVSFFRLFASFFLRVLKPPKTGMFRMVDSNTWFVQSAQRNQQDPINPLRCAMLPDLAVAIKMKRSEGVLPQASVPMFLRLPIGQPILESRFSFQPQPYIWRLREIPGKASCEPQISTWAHLLGSMSPIGLVVALPSL